MTETERSSVVWQFISIGALLIATAISLEFMLKIPFFGDENYYLGAARRLYETLSGQKDISIKQIQADIVGLGWYMPLVSLFSLPLMWISNGQSDIYIFRALFILINLFLLYVIVDCLRRFYSERTSLIFLCILFVCPYYLFRLSSPISDLISIHVAILICFWIDRHASGNKDNSVVIGAMVGAASYIRALYPPLLALWSANGLLHALGSGEPLKSALPAWLGRSAVAVIVFLILILPWSWLVSDRYGFTLTIVTAPISQAVLFDDGTYLAKAREESGIRNRWRAAHRFTQDRALENGITFIEQARRDRDAVLSSAPVSRIVERLAGNLRSFLMRPDELINIFMQARCDSGHCLSASLAAVVMVANRLGWWLLLAAGTFLFCLPMSDRNGSYFMPLLWKGTIFLISLHPLIVTANGRYYAQFVPLFALGIALVATGNWQVYRYRRDLALHDVLIGSGQVLAAAMAVAFVLLMAFG